MVLITFHRHTVKRDVRIGTVPSDFAKPRALFLPKVIGREGKRGVTSPFGATPHPSSFNRHRAALPVTQLPDSDKTERSYRLS